MIKIFKRNQIIIKDLPYRVGQEVYLLGYRKHTEIRLFKAKIIKIEFVDDEPRYYIDIKTGLENCNGCFYGFESKENILKEVTDFIKVEEV